MFESFHNKELKNKYILKSSEKNNNDRTLLKDN